LGQVSAFPEVDIRLSGGPGDVRVGGKVKDGFGPLDGPCQCLEVLEVVAHDCQPGVFGQVPGPARTEIIVDNNPRIRLLQEALHHVAAYKTRTTRYKKVGHKTPSG
jgi:hypothetical protein